MSLPLPKAIPAHVAAVLLVPSLFKDVDAWSRIVRFTNFCAKALESAREAAAPTKNAQQAPCGRHTALQEGVSKREGEMRKQAGHSATLQPDRGSAAHPSMTGASACSPSRRALISEGRRQGLGWPCRPEAQFHQPGAGLLRHTRSHCPRGRGPARRVQPRRQLRPLDASGAHHTPSHRNDCPPNRPAPPPPPWRGGG